jgi:hypothetical protein
MKYVSSITICTLILSFSSCGTRPNKTEDADKPFLDEMKELRPRQEWNQEIVLRNGGPISFRITSDGRFAVTLITKQGYDALISGNKRKINKADILLTVDSKGKSYEGNVTVPAGSSYFIIENQTHMVVRISLVCKTAN